MTALDNPQPISSLDHESEHGRWTLWRRPPAPLLQLYVKGLEGYLEEAGRPVVRDELPSGLVHMIIVLDHGFWLEDTAVRAGVRPLRSTFVAGMHVLPATVGSAGDAVCMQVDFTPLGARRFLGIDNADLAGRVLNLDDLLPEFARTFDGRLREAASWERRFQWLEGCLARRILLARPDDARVEHAWRALYGSGGSLPIGVLADRLNVSPRHLISMFTRQIGVSPKTYARIVRFARAIDMLQRSAGRGSAPLARVAADCGYADQAHFNRDFKQFAGVTPSVLRSRLVGDGAGILVER